MLFPSKMPTPLLKMCISRIPVEKTAIDKLYQQAMVAINLMRVDLSPGGQNNR